jgi:hypothetical protein
MAFSSKDITSFIDSDEVSEIDGIKLIKSRSYTHLKPTKKNYSKSVSFSPGHKVSLMEPNYTNRRNVSQSEDDASESTDMRSTETSEERHKRKRLRRQKREKDLLALPVRDVELANSLLPIRVRQKPSHDQDSISELSEEISVGGTVRKKKRRPKTTSSASQIKTTTSKTTSKTTDLPLIPLTNDEILAAKIEENQTPQSKEDIREMTDGFIVVPRGDWEMLEPGSCIKWVNKHGRCITKEWYYWYQKTSKVTGGKFFYVGMYPTKTDGSGFQQSFAVFWANVKILYKKEDPITKLLRHAIDKRQDYITDLAVFLKMKFGDEFEDYMKSRSAHREKLAMEERTKDKAIAKEKKKVDDQKAQTIRDKYEASKTTKPKETPLTKKPKEAKLSTKKPAKKPKEAKKSKKLLVSVNKFKK